MSFILAGIVLVCTLGFAALQAYADGMRAAPSGDSGAKWTLGIGITLSALLAGSHWLPHIGW